jgi:hypothetical protein
MPCFSNLIICVHVFFLRVCDFVSFDSVNDQSHRAHTFSLWFCSTNEVKGSLMQIYYFRPIHWFTLVLFTHVQPIKSQLCPRMLSVWCKPFCRKNPCWAKTHIIIICCCCWILHYGIQEFPSFIDEALPSGVSHCGLAIYIIKKYPKAKEEELCKTQIFHHAKI